MTPQPLLTSSSRDSASEQRAQDAEVKAFPAAQKTTPRPAWMKRQTSDWVPLQQAAPVRRQGPGTLTEDVLAELRRAARAQAQAEVARERAMARAALEELRRLRGDMVRQMERVASDLALSIASEVLEQDVSARRQFTVSAARIALEHFDGARRIVLRAHPEYHELLAEVVGAHEDVEIVDDTSLAPGGVHASCELGAFDGSLTARFEAVNDRLEDYLAVKEEGDAP